jgi:hypothetical protein
MPGRCGRALRSRRSSSLIRAPVERSKRSGARSRFSGRLEAVREATSRSRAVSLSGLGRRSGRRGRSMPEARTWSRHSSRRQKRRKVRRAMKTQQKINSLCPPPSLRVAVENSSGSFRRLDHQLASRHARRCRRGAGRGTFPDRPPRRSSRSEPPNPQMGSRSSFPRCARCCRNRHP